MYKNDLTLEAARKIKDHKQLIKWHAPAYEANVDNTGISLINDIDFTGERPLKCTRIKGDNLNHAFSITTDESKPLSYSDLDRYLSYEVVEMNNNSIKEQENITEAVTVISFHFGFHKQKLGNEGLMLHYELTRQIAEAFCKEYPHDYDWETHRENGGKDWDVEAEDFAKKWINENDCYVDNDYY